MLSKACNLTLTIGIYWALSYNLNAQDQSTFRFRHYNKDDGLDNRYTRRIITDSLGYVWFHSVEAGLVRFDEYNFDSFSIVRATQKYDEANSAQWVYKALSWTNEFFNDYPISPSGASKKRSL